MMEERGRYEKLEEQMNDLTELHQNEMENIKVGSVEKNKKNSPPPAATHLPCIIHVARHLQASSVIYF